MNPPTDAERQKAGDYLACITLKQLIDRCMTDPKGQKCVGSYILATAMVFFNTKMSDESKKIINQAMVYLDGHEIAERSLIMALMQMMTTSLGLPTPQKPQDTP